MLVDWEQALGESGKRLMGKKIKALHLGIKDTCVRLDDRNGLVESLQSDWCPVTRLQHHGQI